RLLRAILDPEPAILDPEPGAGTDRRRLSVAGGTIVSAEREPEGSGRAGDRLPTGSSDRVDPLRPVGGSTLGHTRRGRRSARRGRRNVLTPVIALHHTLHT